MRKLLFLTTVLIFKLSYAMELTLQNPQKIWREEFNVLPKETYNKSVGYDLGLRLYKDDRSNVIHKFPTILAHGFGASPYTMIEYARVVSPHKIPGDLFVFSFADAYYDGLFFTKSSLGQANDIKSLLMAIRCAYDSQVPGCNLFGQSRGAGTIVNTLAVMNTEVNDWSNEFADIKYFFYKDRVAILDMIKKGVAVLDTPMVTVPAAIQTIRRNVIHRDFLDNFIEKIVLRIITRGHYSSDKMQALDAINNLPEGLKILVSYQKDDKIVGNLHDKKFTESLITRFGKENVCVVLGNDGGQEIDIETWQVLEAAVKNREVQSRLGMSLPYKRVFAHNAGYFILLKRGVVNKFFQKHSSSYVDNEEILSKGEEVLEKSELELCDLEVLFNNYDVHNPLKKENVIQNDEQQDNRFFMRTLLIGTIAIFLNLLVRHYTVTI